MRTTFFALLALLLCLGSQAVRGPISTAKGHLVVVGGGGTIDAVIARALQLAGGPEAHMLVVPQAAEKSFDSGNESKKFWMEKGAKNVAVLDLTDAKAAMAAVEKADFIWMGGGDQVRLMEALANTEIPAAIRKRYEAGAVVGGTSAGAAVISSVMLLGGDKADLTSIKSGGTEVGSGLGLWTTVVVDQHFVKRQRFTRLLACVVDHPDLVGIGIDEKTSVIVSGDSFEVLGESSVLVVDARTATKRESKAGDLLSASDLRLHVLRNGDKFDLAAKAR